MLSNFFIVSRIIILFIFSSIIFLPETNAQEFAPLGATWIYQNTLPFYPALPVLIRYTSEKDTIVNNRSARIIERQALFLGGMWQNDGSEIIASSGDSVFVLIEDEFKLIFDFSRQAGDTLVVTDKPFKGIFLDLGNNSPDLNHFKYLIDSIENITIGDEELNVQYVSYLDDPLDSIFQWGFQNNVALGQIPPYLGRILDGVGSLGFDTPFGTTPGYSYLANLALQELTCYKDSFRTLNFMGINCDSLVDVFENSSSLVNVELHEVRIHPNPFSTTLDIRLPNSDNADLLIYDLSGSLVTKLKSGQDSYDLSSLKAGIYLMKILSKRYIYRTYKIQKL